MSHAPGRGAHLAPGVVAVVALGGACGTVARAAVGEAFGSVALVPTLVVNVLGSFLLGVLLEALARRGTETATGRLLRLGLGTGLLGGFTTFSALAIEVERLLAGGAVVSGAAYGLASLVLGLGACGAGVLLAARGGRPVPVHEADEEPVCEHVLVADPQERRP